MNNLKSLRFNRFDKITALLVSVLIFIAAVFFYKNLTWKDDLVFLTSIGYLFYSLKIPRIQNSGFHKDILCLIISFLIARTFNFISLAILAAIAMVWVYKFFVFKRPIEKFSTYDQAVWAAACALLVFYFFLNLGYLGTKKSDWLGVIMDNRGIIIFLLVSFFVKNAIDGLDFIFIGRRLEISKTLIFCFSVLLLIGVSRTVKSFYHYRQGLSFEKAGNYDAALDNYKKNISLNPVSASGHLRLGVLYSQKKLWDKAISEYRWLSEKAFVNDPDVSFLLAQAYAGQGQLEKAEKEYARLDKKYPRYTDAFLSRIQINMERKNKPAIKALLKEYAGPDIIGLKTPEGFLTLGNFYFELNKAREAVLYFQKAISLGLAGRNIYFNLGAAYERLGKWNEAIEAFEKELQMNPDSVSAIFHLEKLYTKTASADNAMVMRQRIKESSNTFAKAHVIGNSMRSVEIPYIKLYEAENSRMENGKIVFDEKAFGTHAAYIQSKEPQVKDFIYGPYEMLPPGEYRLFFRMKSLGAMPGIIICFIDVLSLDDFGFSDFLARRPIKVSDFASSGQYEDIYLDFYNPGAVKLEFRVCFVESELWVDRIMVCPLGFITDINKAI